MDLEWLNNFWGDKPKHHHHVKRDTTINLKTKGIIVLVILLSLIYLFWKRVSTKVEQTVSELYIPLKGGTMLGDVTFPTCTYVSMDDEPTENTYGANKLYVDKQIKNGLDSFTEIIDNKITTIIKDKSDKYLPIAGGTMYGDLNFTDKNTVNITSEPLNKEHAVNKDYVDKYNLAFKQSTEDLIDKTFETFSKTYLPLVGGTMLGDITMVENTKVTIPRPPVEDIDGVNKAYADGQYKDLKNHLETIIKDANDGIQTDLQNMGKLYLPLAGGSMEGNITFPKDHIINISSDPLTDTSGTNKKYVDGEFDKSLEYLQNLFEEINNQIKDLQLNTDKSFLPLAGGTMSGAIVMPTKTGITIVDPPAEDTSAVNKAYITLKSNELITYVDDSISTQYLKDKQYMDDELKKLTDLASKYLPLAGGTMTGNISLPKGYIDVNNPPAEGYHVTNKNYVDGVASDTLTYLDDQIAKAKDELPLLLGFLPLKGGTMTGTIVIPSSKTVSITDPPSTPQSAVNKEYVDNLTSSYLPLSGGTMKGTITMASGTVVTVDSIPTKGTDAVNKTYVDDMIKALGANYLPLAGGTMTGPIIMPSDNTITLTDPPVEDTDAVNKKYVDSYVLKISLQCTTKGLENGIVTFNPPTVDLNNKDGYVKLVDSKSFVIGLEGSWRVYFTGSFTTDTTVTLGNVTVDFKAEQANAIELLLDVASSITLEVKYTGSPTFKFMGTLSIMQLV